ncbi:MAG: hypothetical protein Q7T51_03460 [Candidatus Moranbacteria bacterium]|nr:hypothetical protein [Candidatus Moranbacteria bacterium]
MKSQAEQLLSTSVKTSDGPGISITTAAILSIVMPILMLTISLHIKDTKRFISYSTSFSKNDNTNITIKNESKYFIDKIVLSIDSNGIYPVSIEDSNGINLMAKATLIGNVPDHGSVNSTNNFALKIENLAGHAIISVGLIFPEKHVKITPVNSFPENIHIVENTNNTYLYNWYYWLPYSIILLIFVYRVEKYRKIRRNAIILDKCIYLINREFHNNTEDFLKYTYDDLCKRIKHINSAIASAPNELIDFNDFGLKNRYIVGDEKEYIIFAPKTLMGLPTFRYRFGNRERVLLYIEFTKNNDRHEICKMEYHPINDFF